MKKFWPLFVLLGAAWIYLVVVATARAHDWYADTGCCYGEGERKDCDPAPPGSIREVDGGYVVTLTKDEMVRIRPSLITDKAWHALTWGITEFVPANKVKAAQSAGFHLCLKATATQTSKADPLTWVLCFFAPGNS